MTSTSLEAALALASPAVRSTLEACLEGHELDVAPAIALCHVEGHDLEALRSTADELRRRQAGERVGYVVNRNINFTNVCVKACTFCAFARNHRSEKGYFLEADEVVRRALEARDLGATEVCIQAGLAPGMSGRTYIDLCKTVKAAAPDLHLHAFSPEEVKYGAGLAGLSIAEYLAELKDAGLGSLPGTSAEILDDSVRDRIAPGRISTAEWVELISTAHRLGLPTTSTIMFGHVESDAERIGHLALLRRVQKETGGFTEFVPLSFVHHEAPMFTKQLLPMVRPGPSPEDVVRFFAISRLMLGPPSRTCRSRGSRRAPSAPWSCFVRGPTISAAPSSTRASPPPPARGTGSSSPLASCATSPAAPAASPSSATLATAS